MASNLEVNYKEISNKKEKDSQDYLEVLFINADKIRESIDAATSKIIRDATEQDVKIKEMSISDGRMFVSLNITRRTNHITSGTTHKVKHVSTLTLLYEGPEDAHTIGKSLWTY